MDSKDHAVSLAHEYVRAQGRALTAKQIYAGITHATSVPFSDFRTALRAVRTPHKGSGHYTFGSGAEAGDYPPGLQDFLSTANKDNVAFEAVMIEGMKYLNSSQARIELQSPENARAFFEALSNSNGLLVLRFIEMKKPGLKFANLTLFRAALDKAKAASRVA